MLRAHARVAALVGAVDADAQFALVAKALAQVHMAARHVVRAVAGGDLPGGRVFRPLGHHVDRAAHPARRRHAVEQGVGAFQHFNALQAFNGQRIGGQDAVQAVEGDVAVQDRKAPNGKLVETAGSGVGVLHRGIVGHHVGHALRLLLLHQGAGVGRYRKGRVHDASFTQHADAGAAGHLAAGKRGHQAAGVGARHRYRFQLGHRIGGHGGQGVFVGPGRNGPQARARQQRGKAIRHRVVAVQPR
ncbi:hypothetical protein D3C71_1371770 [compost metagenome]